MHSPGVVYVASAQASRPSAECDGASGPTSGDGWLRGSTALVAASQESHAICTALAQNPKGLALSTKRPNASKEGTACRLIEICSASPPGPKQLNKTNPPGAPRGGLLEPFLAT
jgi:hypothetical protein